MKVRIQEHLKARRNRSIGISIFADPLIDTGHSYKEGSETLLHVENNFFKRRAFEDIEIERHKKCSDTILLNQIIPEDGFINYT